MTDTEFEDGIYFGMDEIVYHEIPRLSNSGMKKLAVSPLDFWTASWMNSRRKPDRDSKAKKVGRAVHKLLLEGDEAFDLAYAVAPSRDDYPDAIEGNAALQDTCVNLGLKKSGTAAELCARIREVDAVVPLWAEILAEFKDSLEGRVEISRDLWDEIQQMRFVLNHMPEIKGAFANGMPEVTLLWHERDVAMKARLDFLKLRGKLPTILEVKSFGNVMGKPIKDAPQEEIGRNNYFIQPVTYCAARDAIGKMWRAEGMDIVHVLDGPEPPFTWLDGVLRPEKAAVAFIFVQTGGVPNILPVEFIEAEQFGGQGWQMNEYWRKGRSQFMNGLRDFRRYLGMYGADAPWVTSYNVRRLRDEDFKPWALEYDPGELVQDEAA